MKKIWGIGILSLAMALTSASPGHAEVYHFIDKDGVSHFSNVPADPRYKKLLITRAPQKRAVSGQQRARILHAIEKTSVLFGLDPALVKAVVRAESDFDPMAISSAGAMGLMQLMPATAIRWSVSDPMDPEENVLGGVRYLRHLIDLFDGQLHLALAGYHAGENSVQRHGGIPPIPATQVYVQRVLKFYDSYRGPDRKTAIYRVTTPQGDEHYTDNPERYPSAEKTRSAMNR